MASSENGNNVEYSSEVKKVPSFNILSEYNVIRYSNNKLKYKIISLNAFLK
jgi:hypothetical protein